MIIEQRFTINYHYNVHFIADVFSIHNTTFSDILLTHSNSGFSPSLLFVIDSNVGMRHPQLQQAITNYLDQRSPGKLNTYFLTIPGGEKAKENDHAYQAILRAINQFNIDRHSFVIAIGGGAVCDVTGFAATVAHRGIKLIRIPTTTLAQNDAAIGVKNGINAFDKKNFLGTFATPVAVINDSAFLKTLSQRTWISGISEAIKVALIKDARFFERIEQLAPAVAERDEAAMQETIIECARLHLQHIANGDPFEAGSSRPLDFGHWSAHKLERMSDYKLLHGEAVAIGIALDCTYANLMGYLGADALDRILELLWHLNLPIAHPLLERTEELLRGLHEFSAHLGGVLTIPLLTSIGHARNVTFIDEQVMQQAAKRLIAISQSTSLV
ncbi:3-dehydroquinate synthase [Niabella sp. CC-SYL272]|uniref:3-dehydroquinate synthase n=1 Tax=Niabella agricola TaxID=2891571 RepID=UPI001F21CB7C|nr:3-dehydroquinate synthase [Niabella agricola]MCF3108775.1 3-dehydroquinate synthase [Niabella agricola]